MINYQNKTSIKLISLILTQIFLFTGLTYPESASNKDISSIYKKTKDLRVPMMGSSDKRPGRLEEVIADIEEAIGKTEETVLNYLKELGYDKETPEARISGQELENLRISLNNQEDPVVFAGRLIDELKNKVDSYNLYLALIGYAGFIRGKAAHVETRDHEKYFVMGTKIVDKAIGLKLSNDEDERNLQELAAFFINELNTATGTDIERLKQAVQVLRRNPVLEKELQREYPWRYDLFRHLIGYVDQISEDGDMTLIGSPIRFTEYLDEIYRLYDAGKNDSLALQAIIRITARIKNEFENFEVKEEKPVKFPKEVKQINLDAEAPEQSRKFRWLIENLDRYQGYDAIQLVGSLQAMAPNLSPYSIAGFYFDPRYGVDKDFKELVAKARDKGIEIVMDVVLRHVGDDSSGFPLSGDINLQKGPWGYEPDYDDTKAQRQGLWFLARLKKLGINIIRCDQMGGLRAQVQARNEFWRKARSMGLVMISEWENASDVPYASAIYFKGVRNRLKEQGMHTFRELKDLVEARLREAQGYETLLVIDDHDEQQLGSVVDIIGKDKNGKYNTEKLKAYYLAMYMLQLLYQDRVAVMEHSGVAEGYPQAISFMYKGTRSYVDFQKEAREIFPDFAEFSENVRRVVLEILNHKGDKDIRLSLSDDNQREDIQEIDLKDDSGNVIKRYTFIVNLKEGEYRVDLKKMELGEIAQGMPLAAKLFFKNGQVVTEPRWLKLQVVLSVALRSKTDISAEKISPEAETQMKAKNALAKDAKLDPIEVKKLLNELTSSGLLVSRTDEKTEESSYEVTSQRMAAVWADDYEYIRDDINSALNDKAELKDKLLEYEKYCDMMWHDYPVEAFYTLLDAISTLDKISQGLLMQRIGGFEKEDPADFYKHRVFNVIALNLSPSSEVRKDWLERYAPNLVDRTIVIAAAEISRMAGGLGRVLNYKTVELLRLLKEKGNCVWVEPLYSDFNEPMEKVGEFSINMRGKDVKAEVFKRKKIIQVPNEKGEIEDFEIEDFLIRDTAGYYVGKLYKYEQEDSRATLDEFTEFFSKSVVEFTNLMAARAIETNSQQGWKDPVLNIHDGQCLPIAYWRREFYKLDSEKYKFLKKIPVMGVTHTYNNRALVYFDSIDEARKFLSDKLGVKKEYHWYFLRRFFNKVVVDFSTSGIRTTNGENGVARMHAVEINLNDSMKRLLGITNGDLRELSARDFRRILRGIFSDVDVEHPSASQVVEAKISAKENLRDLLKKKSAESGNVHGYIELDPRQFIISYFGRLVPEKFGMGDRLTGDMPALTKDNIRHIVRSGGIVFVAGNVQPYADSIELYRNLKDLAEEIEKDKRENGEKSVYKGTFIFVDKFILEEQLAFLAATDLQAQISRRGTGASEYTESDATANGALHMGPPWIEGIIQLQGVILDRQKSGSGNTIVPYANTENAYLEAFMWALDCYNNRRMDYAQYQANSIPLSRKLGVLNTAAAYLMYWNQIIGEGSDFDIELEPRNDVMLEAGLKLYGAHIQELKPTLLDPDEKDIQMVISNGQVEVKATLSIAPGVIPPRVFIKTNAPTPTQKDNWEIFSLNLDSFDGQKAMYAAKIPVDSARQGFHLTWKIGDIWLGDTYNNARVKVLDNETNLASNSLAEGFDKDVEENIAALRKELKNNPSVLMKKADGEDLIIAYAKKNPDCYIGFGDMRLIGGFNMVFTRGLVDKLIPLMINAANTVLKKYGGIAIRISGDEVGIALPGNMSPAYINNARLELQATLAGFLSGMYGFVKVRDFKEGDIDSDEIAGVYKDKDGFFLVFDRQQGIPPNIAIEGNPIDMPSPRLSFGIVKLSDEFGNDSYANYNISVRHAEYVKNIAGDNHLNGAIWKTLGESDKFNEAIKNPSIPRLSKGERDEIVSKYWAAGIDLRDEHIDEYYPVIKREYLYFTIQQMKSAGVGTAILVRGPPDNFYLVKKISPTSIILIKLEFIYEPGGGLEVEVAGALKDGKFTEESLRFKKWMNGYGFKVINEFYGHSKANEVILEEAKFLNVLSGNIYDFFELDEEITDNLNGILRNMGIEAEVRAIVSAARLNVDNIGFELIDMLDDMGKIPLPENIFIVKKSGGNVIRIFDEKEREYFEKLRAKERIKERKKFSYILDQVYGESALNDRDFGVKLASNDSLNKGEVRPFEGVTPLEDIKNSALSLEKLFVPNKNVSPVMTNLDSLSIVWPLFMKFYLMLLGLEEEEELDRIDFNGKSLIFVGAETPKIPLQIARQFPLSRIIVINPKWETKKGGNVIVIGDEVQQLAKYKDEIGMVDFIFSSGLFNKEWLMFVVDAQNDSKSVYERMLNPLVEILSPDGIMIISEGPKISSRKSRLEEVIQAVGLKIANEELGIDTEVGIYIIRRMNLRNEILERNDSMQAVQSGL